MEPHHATVHQATTTGTVPGAEVLGREHGPCQRPVGWRPVESTPQPHPSQDVRRVFARRKFQAGYNHSIANIMTTASMRTGLKATFDEKNQEVLAGGKVFKY